MPMGGESGQKRADRLLSVNPSVILTIPIGADAQMASADAPPAAILFAQNRSVQRGAARDFGEWEEGS
jgi:hypothetical protein